jgi:cytochrome P450
MCDIANIISGFDFHAIDDVNSKWVNVYTDINDGLRDRKFFSFPILDQKFLWLLPKRRQLHKKMDYFLDMLDDVIKVKRDLLKKGHVHNDDLEENERDLLTLMIESENRDEGNLSDAELKVKIILMMVHIMHQS